MKQNKNKVNKIMLRNNKPFEYGWYLLIRGKKGNSQSLIVRTKKLICHCAIIRKKKEQATRHQFYNNIDSLNMSAGDEEIAKALQEKFLAEVNNINNHNLMIL